MAGAAALDHAHSFVAEHQVYRGATQRAQAVTLFWCAMDGWGMAANGAAPGTNQAELACARSKESARFKHASMGVGGHTKASGLCLLWPDVSPTSAYCTQHNSGGMVSYLGCTWFVSGYRPQDCKQEDINVVSGCADVLMHPHARPHADQGVQVCGQGGVD